MLKIIKQYPISIFVTISIFILVLIPISSLPKVNTPFFSIDKIVHLFIFMVWTIVIQFEIRKNLNLYLLLLSGFGFGLFTEFLQIFTKDRVFDMIDAMYDGIGVGLGILFFQLFTLFQKPR